MRLWCGHGGFASTPLQTQNSRLSITVRPCAGPIGPTEHLFCNPHSSCRFTEEALQPHDNNGSLALFILHNKSKNNLTGYWFPPCSHQSSQALPYGCQEKQKPSQTFNMTSWKDDFLLLKCAPLPPVFMIKITHTVTLREKKQTNVWINVLSVLIARRGKAHLL